MYRVVRWAMRGFDAADSERTVRRESPTSPRQHHSTLMPTKTAGRVGRAKKLPHSSPKGALTTTRPLLVNARPTGETCAKNFADTCYTASGPRAGSKRSGTPGETTLHNQGPETVLRDRTCNTTKRSCGTGLAS